MTREEYNARNLALDNYLNTQGDVNAAAIQDAANKGISPESVGRENYDNVLRNFAVGHITTKAIKNSETRVDAEGNDIIANFVSSPSGRNINLSIIGAVDAGQPVFEYVNVDSATGNALTHYEGAGGGDPDVPLLGSLPDPTIPDPSDNGDDVIYGPPPGDTSGGIMSGPVGLEAGALNPVTSLIGTPTTAQTDANQTTLMGQTAGLATGQQGIRDIVTPLGEQVTALDTKVTPLASDIGTVKTDVGGIKTDVGTVKAGVGDVQSAIGTPAEGQTLLGGQQGIMSGIGTAGTGQTDLFKGQADLTAGQTGIQSAIGTADPEIEQPATLFEGQAGLAATQSGLMSGQRGITRDLTTEIGDVSSALGSQLGAFRTAAENYQRGATTQRGDIQGTQRANQANMLSQIQGVAQPINRQAEALANQRQREAASFSASQAPLQKQIATLTANNANQAANNQPIGPMGPMATDPRDALIQQLLTRNASLMNNRPV
jgi:hypothetical protein